MQQFGLEIGLSRVAISMNMNKAHISIDLV